MESWHSNISAVQSKIQFSVLDLLLKLADTNGVGAVVLLDSIYCGRDVLRQNGISVNRVPDLGDYGPWRTIPDNQQKRSSITESRN
ncbi:hypothetical protein Bca101_067194 [Brassica carinata]